MKTLGLASPAAPSPAEAEALEPPSETPLPSPAQHAEPEAAAESESLVECPPLPPPAQHAEPEAATESKPSIESELSVGSVASVTCVASEPSVSSKVSVVSEPVEPEVPYVWLTTSTPSSPCTTGDAGQSGGLDPAVARDMSSWGKLEDVTFYDKLCGEGTFGKVCKGIVSMADDLIACLGQVFPATAPGKGTHAIKCISKSKVVRYNARNQVGCRCIMMHLYRHIVT